MHAWPKNQNSDAYVYNTYYVSFYVCMCLYKYKCICLIPCVCLVHLRHPHGTIADYAFLDHCRVTFREQSPFPYLISYNAFSTHLLH